MTAKLDIESLRALKAVAASGGVTRAALELGLSQSAVSHKLKRLEESIDHALLTRRAGGPLLTDTGQRLLTYADRMIALHDEAAATLGRRALTGAVRLGMTEDMSCGGVSRVLSRFRATFPDVTVHVRVNQSLVVRKALADGAVDVGVMQVFENETVDTDIVLRRDNLVWVKGRELTLAQDSPVPFVAYDDNCFYKDWLVETLGTLKRPVDTVLIGASNAGIAAAVEAGLGVSIVNERHVSTAMDRITGIFPAPPPIVYVARAGGGTPSNAVRALLDTIADETSDTLGILAA